MNIEQIKKILITAIVATALMFVFEIIFDIPVINDWIKGWVDGQSKIVVYIVVWLLMYIQVAFVPIPAVIILTVSIGAGILNTTSGLGIFTLGQTWIYILVVASAYMIGACTAYWIGLKWGKKAVLWCAGSEEEYLKWSNFFNRPMSKWIYGATVLLPVFPDDLLCVVAGSVRFDFKFWFIVNLIGRTIGLIFMIGSLALIGAGGGSPLAAIAWGVALLAEIVALIILKNKPNFKSNKDF